MDIDAGNRLVELIKPLARKTRRPGTKTALGGFGALFDPAAAGYHDPILVATTDGVGTKLKVAIDAGRHDTIGIDLVAMCVNDLVVQGAEPLFFLDYFATGALDVEMAADVVAGIARGCQQARCALIGGETAEMPGIYAAGEYDLAGFAVGAVAREAVITGESARPGDRLIALASSGLHANGFSLVRRIVADLGLAYDGPAPFDCEGSLADVLLEPTRIYVDGALALAGAGLAKAMAHITGGGVVENLPRVLPAGVGAEIDTGAWTPPEVFNWLAKAGNLTREELMRTFNCGVGMIVAVAPDRTEKALDMLMATGESAFVAGFLVDRPGIHLKGAPWPD